MKHKFVDRAFTGLATAAFLLCAQQLVQRKVEQDVSARILKSTMQVITTYQEPVTNVKAAKDSQRKASVKTEPSTSSGTAFYFNSNGDAVTDYHVVENKIAHPDAKFEIKSKDGTTHNATIVCQNKRDDMAIIHVDGVSNTKYLPLGNSSDIKMGDELITVGNTLGLGLRATFGRVASIDFVEDSKYNKGEKRGFINLDININPGNSGGASTDTSGAVVGVADEYFYARGMALFTPADIIKNDIQACEMEPGGHPMLPKPSFSLDITSFGIHISL